MFARPLRFKPIFRRYVWGGRRLATVLGKAIGEGVNYAESWEIVDHGGDQSVLSSQEDPPVRLGDLLQQHQLELLGTRDASRFPLLFKFLDAHENLSVQVHPNDEQAAKLNPPDLGKTEAWVVLYAEPGSVIFAGLKPGVGRDALQQAVDQGTTQACLHQIEPQVGDCIFVPAGTVHAIGAGLVVAEIQQSSDSTFRLFDWNRPDPDGLRPLHIEQCMEVIDFDRGPVRTQVPAATDAPQAARLVACEKFVLDRWRIHKPVSLGGDQRFHLLAVTEGSLRFDGDPAPLQKGRTALLPASLGAVDIRPIQPCTFLDIYLPC